MRSARLSASIGLSALAVLTACSGDDDPDPAPSSAPTGAPTATASPTPTTAAYNGPELPGLAAEPAWSVPLDTFGGRDADVVALGDTVVVVRNDTSGPSGSATPSAGTERPVSAVRTLEFRDAATGTVRKSVASPVATLTRDVWAGTPVAVVAYQAETVSDGLSEEKRVQVVAAYDAAGTKVGEHRGEGDVPNFAVTGGWVLTVGKDSQTATVAKVGGGKPVRVECPAALCRFSTDGRTAAVGTSTASTNPLVGDTVFVFADGGRGTQLVALDAATGTQRWRSNAVQPPPGVIAEGEDAFGTRVVPMGMIGDKVALGWLAKGRTSWVAGLHDPRTGKLLFAGPTMPFRFTPLLTEDGTIAVLVAGATEGTSGSAAWSVSDGKVLWTQRREGEKGLVGRSIVNDVLYGHTAEYGAAYLALDVRTKKVLASNLELPSAPIAAGPDHAVVKRGGTLYGFPTS